MANLRSNLGNFFNAHKWGICILILINILHNIGLTTNPEYFFDEFLYSARAWAFVKFGALEMPPDTVSFDHPPFGWIFMGVICVLMIGVQWTIRARIFISIMFGISSITIYGIGTKYYNKITGIIAILFFGGMAGFIKYQKEILLDNIGVMWFLLAIYYIFRSPINDSNPISNDLNTISLNLKSALFFGLAIVTKFPFVVFYPAFIVFFYTHSRSWIQLRNRTIFRKEVGLWLKWILVSLLPFALFILYILISGNFLKFFDATWVQVTRVNPDASLSMLYALWISDAPIFFIELPVITLFFIGIGLFIGIINFRKMLLPVTKNKKFEIIEEKEMKFDMLIRCGFEISIFNAIYLVFLLRGGFVLPHYIIPLGPIGALLLAIFTVYILRPLYFSIKEPSLSKYEKNLKKGQGFRNLPDNNSNEPRKQTIQASIICGIILIGWVGIHFYPYQYADPTVNQNKYLEDALAWVIANLPKDSFIVVYGFFTAELREAGFRYAQTIWFMDYTSLQGNSLIIDYFICPTLGMVNTENTAAAVERAELIQSFSQGEGDSLKIMNVYQVIK